MIETWTGKWKDKKKTEKIPICLFKLVTKDHLPVVSSCSISTPRPWSLSPSAMPLLQRARYRKPDVFADQSRQSLYTHTLWQHNVPSNYNHVGFIEFPGFFISLQFSSITKSYRKEFTMQWITCFLILFSYAFTVIYHHLCTYHTLLQYLINIINIV